MTGQSPKPPTILQGFRWWRHALILVARNLRVFLIMGIIVAFIQMIPFVGAFIIMIAGPALIAGSVVAAHAATTGGTPVALQLFSMFETPAQRGEALKLCLPLLAGKVVALLIVSWGLARQIAASGLTIADVEKNPQQLLQAIMNGAMVPPLLLGIAVVLVAWMFTAMAIPRVALRQERAWSAMRASLAQVWHGIAAWVVVVVLLFAGLVLLTMILMLATGSPLVIQIGLSVVLYTVLGPLLYVAWSDGDDDARHPPPRGSDRTNSRQRGSSNDVLEA